MELLAMPFCLSRPASVICGELNHKKPARIHRSCSSIASAVFGQFSRKGVNLLLHLHSSSTHHSQRLGGTMCLMGGVGGGFWEDAGNESKPNNQLGPFNSTTNKEPSVLLSLIQEIEPLDISLIIKDASSKTTDAMKRTISGMLGLLPSDQFHVIVEVSREPLGRLLVSSMMTGYTLRNAEYRLCLQRNLELTEEDLEARARGGKSLDQKQQAEEGGDKLKTGPVDEQVLGCDISNSSLEESLDIEATSRDNGIPPELGQLAPEVVNYIRYLQTKVSLVAKELDECKLGNTGLQMQSFVGDEKNELLDYLRSLEPDKVAELSQPTSSEVENVIHQVIGMLLEKICSEQHAKSSQFSTGTSCLNSTWEQDGTEFVGSPSMQFQSLMMVTRDYLARLLFWCMLLGHHIRGLEYRLELSRALSLSGDFELGAMEG